MSPPTSPPTSREMWNELVTVSLLGTDRRDPPALAAGPVADVVADALRPTPQGRLLASVSAMVVAQRCGAQPLPPRPPLMAPPGDSRPLLPVDAARRWSEIAIRWPVLEPEWLAVASATGWRPAPDVLVALLRRHRRSPIAAAAVMAFGGPLATWMVEHLPELAPPHAARPAGEAPDVRRLPVPSGIDGLLDGPAGPLADGFVVGLADGTFKWSHRAVLLNAIARVPRRSLDAVAAALESGRDALEHEAGIVGEPGAPLSLWESLIELAIVRRRMLHELQRGST